MKRFEDYKNELVEKVNKECGNNAEYVLRDMSRDLRMFDYYIKDFVSGCETEEYTRRMLEFCVEDGMERAINLNKNVLTPVTAKVGDGATINLYSDRHACTIIKVTKCTVTVRRDKATLDPNFKPEWVAGGFAGHCINQDEQTYSYEPDPDGSISTFYWSKKYNRFGTPGDPSLSKGRHEFYDYNF